MYLLFWRRPQPSYPAHQHNMYIMIAIPTGAVAKMKNCNKYSSCYPVYAIIHAVYRYLNSVYFDAAVTHGNISWDGEAMKW